jgi:ABC-2 type transport system permease protein
MSGRGGPVRIVAGREIAVRLQERSFLVSTALSLLAIVAIAVVPVLFGGDGPGRWQIGAVGTTAGEAAELAAAAAPADRDAEVIPLAADAADAAVRDGDVDVVLLADGSLVGDEDVDDQLQGLLQGAWAQQQLVDALVAAGVPAADAVAVASAPPGEVRLLDPPDEERDRHVGFVVVGVLLLYGQLVGYGYWVATGVVEEKTSRVVEVLLTRVRPRQLLAGKMAGLGALGLGQFVVFVAVGLAAFAASGRFSIPPGVWPSAAGLLVWFLVGFVVYAALFALAGALAGRVEDLQNSSGPVLLVVTASFMGTVAAAGDPGGTLARVLSFLPPSAPLAMPMRMAHGGVAVWEVAVAGALTVAAAYALVLLAERAYTGAALRSGARTPLRAALRAGR